MATFNTQKVDVAVSNHSKLDVSSTHITTASFMQLNPIKYRHVLPGEHLVGKANALTRLAPVSVPSYGRCRLNLRSFFVPFRLVFPNFNEFITDTIGSNVSTNSLIDGSPYVTNNDLMTFFLTGVDPDFNPLVTAVTNPNDPEDFVTTTGTRYRLSYYGRHYLKVLQSLGYRIVWDDKNHLNFDYSALPILCYAKVYVDWYANAAYYDSVEYLTIQRWFKFNDPTSSLHMDNTMLQSFFDFVHVVCYDGGNDVFVNAWDNPVAPNAGNFSPLQGYDVSALTLSTTPTVNNQFQVLLDSNGTPYMAQSAATSTSIGTEYLHEFLKSATDYIKRNQLSGAAQIDRFLSRFGINLNSAKAGRSIYISSQSIDVDFGSVMSNANTAGAGNTSNLGEYGGVGMGRGELSFDFTADEFGLFIICSSIVPASSLYQGFDRNLLHLRKTDFFTPEFDNLGCQAITKGEVYVSTNGAYGTPPDYRTIFGFAPRYYEYKQALDFVTGDFISPCAMVGGDAWHLNREINDATFLNDVDNQIHSLNFTRGVDAGQYDRIFNYDDPDYDKFYIVYHFDAMTHAPCKSLFDTYDFDDAGQQLSMNGNSAKTN